VRAFATQSHEHPSYPREPAMNSAPVSRMALVLRSEHADERQDLMARLAAGGV